MNDAAAGGMSYWDKRPFPHFAALLISIAVPISQIHAQSQGSMKAQAGQDRESAAAAPNPTSVSPDKRWEYKCAEYGVGQCAPEIVKAGTAEVVLDLDEEVHGPEARQAEVVWASDSKRFAFNYSPPHAHHTTYKTVAFYQLRGDKWGTLHPPADEASERAQLTQLAGDHLPKSTRERRIWRSSPVNDTLKVREWTDANTVIVYAYSAWDQLTAGFLFTLKFNEAGDWKIVKTRQMSTKELEEEQ